MSRPSDRFSPSGSREHDEYVRAEAPIGYQVAVARFADSSGHGSVSSTQVRVTYHVAQPAIGADRRSTASKPTPLAMRGSSVGTCGTMRD